MQVLACCCSVVALLRSILILPDANAARIGRIYSNWLAGGRHRRGQRYVSARGTSADTELLLFYV